MSKIEEEYYENFEDILMEIEQKDIKPISEALSDILYSEDYAKIFYEDKSPLERILPFVKDDNFEHFWSLEASVKNLENQGWEIVKADKHPDIFKSGSPYGIRMDGIEYKNLILMRREKSLCEEARTAKNTFNEPNMYLDELKDLAKEFGYKLVIFKE